MTYHRIRNQNNTTCATSGAGTEFTPVFIWVRVARSLVICVLFFVDRYMSLCRFYFGYVLSVLLFKDSDYFFDIFWLCVICPSI